MNDWSGDDRDYVKKFGRLGTEARRGLDPAAIVIRSTTCKTSSPYAEVLVSEASETEAASHRNILPRYDCCVQCTLACTHCGYSCGYDNYGGMLKAVS